MYFPTGLKRHHLTILFALNSEGTILAPEELKELNLVILILYAGSHIRSSMSV